MKARKVTDHDRLQIAKFLLSGYDYGTVAVMVGVGETEVEVEALDMGHPSQERLRQAQLEIQARIDNAALPGRAAAGARQFMAAARGGVSRETVEPIVGRHHSFEVRSESPRYPSLGSPQRPPEPLDPVPPPELPPESVRQPPPEGRTAAGDSEHPLCGICGRCHSCVAAAVGMIRTGQVCKHERVKREPTGPAVCMDCGQIYAAEEGWRRSDYGDRVRTKGWGFTP